MNYQFVLKTCCLKPFIAFEVWKLAIDIRFQNFFDKPVLPSLAISNDYIKHLRIHCGYISVVNFLAIFFSRRVPDPRVLYSPFFKRLHRVQQVPVFYTHLSPVALQSATGPSTWVRWGSSVRSPWRWWLTCSCRSAESCCQREASSASVWKLKNKNTCSLASVWNKIVSVLGLFFF